MILFLPLLMLQCKKEEPADLDVVKPTVTSTVSVNSAVNVSLNSISTASFSEPMDPLTMTSSTFTLKQGTTTVPGVVTYNGLVADFAPAANLAANTIYTATITTGAQDLAGNALASNYVWNFTTGVAPDITPPTIISNDPLNAETDVALNKIVRLTFSEALDPLTINSTTFRFKDRDSSSSWYSVLFWKYGNIYSVSHSHSQYFLYWLFCQPE